MKHIIIAIYGDFKKKDIKSKIVSSDEQFRFQNILISAGYDCELHSFDVEDTNK